jgi:acylphosphatase
MTETQSALHAWVEGRVQGVGFRAFVQDQAQRLSLTGWVRNVGDDQVEVWGEGPQPDLDTLLGPQPDLDTLLAALQRGPRSSYVSDVRVEWETATGKFGRFQVISSSY